MSRAFGVNLRFKKTNQIENSKLGTATGGRLEVCSINDISLPLNVGSPKHEDKIWPNFFGFQSPVTGPS